MSRASNWQRARAARVIRDGGTYAQAAREAGVHVRTVFRWSKDPTFLELLAGSGVITLGPVRVRTSADAVLDDVPADESWVWIDCNGPPAVLGSLLVDDARHMRAVFVSVPDRVVAVREALGQRRFPVLAGERTAVLVPQALAVLQDDPEALGLLVRICTAPPVEAFRAFLSVWSFRAQETKDVRRLGDDLWPAQETFVREIAEHPHVYALKARKLGQTTIACAYDAYVLRFRDENARVHLFSHVEKAALELLQAVRFGLDRLPDFLRLPDARRTAHELELDAGAHDRRLAVTYATTASMAIESTSTHAHIDEWADMPRPDRVYQSLEPTFTAPGCTSLIVTTAAGLRIRPPATGVAVSPATACTTRSSSRRPPAPTATRPGSRRSGARCCRTPSPSSTRSPGSRRSRARAGTSSSPPRSTPRPRTRGSSSRARCADTST
jgi:hypothetical protein